MLAAAARSAQRGAAAAPGTPKSGPPRSLGADTRLGNTSLGDTFSIINPFMPTVPTFAVRETDVSRHNGGALSAPLKPLRDDSALRTLSSLRGLRGAQKEPPLCRETSISRTANVGTVGKNGLI